MKTKLLATILFVGFFCFNSYSQADLTLAPSTLSAMPTNLYSGQTINISFDVKNIGNGSCPQSHVEIYISPNPNFNGAQLISRVSLESLSVNATSSVKFVYPVPYNIGAGVNYVIIYIDPLSEITELDENNNSYYSNSININTNGLATQNLPYPLIYVHGLASDNNTWNKLLITYQNMYGWSYGGNMNFCLNQDNDVSTGNIVTNYKDWTNTSSLNADDFYTVNFNVDDATGNPYPDTWYYHNYSNQSAIVKQGYAIRDAIKHVLAITGKNKVILVGHSMGGLACREYLENPYLWQPNGHDVAKLVTIGTPHLGSNTSGYGLDPLFNSVEESSEAVGDLRTSYFYSGNPGVFLFSGIEDLSYMNDQLSKNFCNANVNCNGGINDNITGLNYLPIPKNINYSCVFGTGQVYPNDGVVDANKAYINNSFYPSLPVDTFVLKCPYYQVTSVWHTDLPSQIDGNILGIDEANELTLGYDIDFNKMYFGLISRQSTTGYIHDYDDYKINIPSTGNLNIQIYNIPTGQSKIDIIDSNYKSIYSINSNGRSYMNINTPTLNSGQYFLELSSDADSCSWKYQYAFKLSFSSSTSVNDFSNKISDVLNYPNPFNEKTTILFTLLEKSNISINVYNSFGQLVSVLVNEKMDTGKHSVEFDGSNLTSGIYYYIIQSNNIFISNKIVLEK